MHSPVKSQILQSIYKSLNNIEKKKAGLNEGNYSLIFKLIFKYNLFK